jgi:hypothetical protein
MLATVMLLKLIDATLGLRVGIDEELLVPPRAPPLLSSPLPSPQHPMLALSVPVHAAFTGLGNDAKPFGTVRVEEVKKEQGKACVGVV